MLPKNARLCEGLVFTLILFNSAESDTCLKRQSIGYRENNVYECNHPVYSECCEHSNRFTCCEPNFTKNLRQQLQLWGCVAVMLAVVAVVYSCWSREQDLIQSETLTQAVHNLRYKLSRRKEKPENEMKNNDTSSDKLQLTSFAVNEAPSPTPSLPTGFYHNV